MSTTVTSSIREVLLEYLGAGLERKGLGSEVVTDDTDFFSEQLIDSFGLLELILALEDRFSITIDLEEAADTDDLTVVGPFCGYVESVIRCT